ncbi:N-acetylmuramoyl-L-alanine amidase family protein [Sphingomonas elodea]|uniref:N-acetylmuramoyl-L-alanine amidase family protein n=1 Tax=Sphingomonas elodea TaxID=179878 RepID=UPI0002630CE4|nr:N-acetylmuramoyl-L-alanine amidase [Sphingomonas elodea]
MAISIRLTKVVIADFRAGPGGGAHGIAAAVSWILLLLAGWATGLPGWVDAVARLRVEDGAVVVPVPAAGETGALRFAWRSPDYSVSLAMPAPVAAAGGPLPKVRGAAGLPLVMLDPGHGGRDPGAPGVDGTTEKALTLAAAQAIRDALLASGRVRVAMTREDDSFVPLQQRTDMGRRLGAALFLSLHCDSAADPLASGGTLYTLSDVASDKESARLAARENRADLIAGIDLGSERADIASLLIDLAQRRTMGVSARYADLLAREVAPVMHLHARPRRMAALVVLKAPDMPSVLFELGYVSNEADATALTSPEGRARLAAAVRRATEIFLATR